MNVYAADAHKLAAPPSWAMLASALEALARRGAGAARDDSREQDRCRGCELAGAMAEHLAEAAT